MRATAIVLAGGRGSRMSSATPKQYMDINGKPVLYYSLKCFEDNSHIQNIILVTGEGEQAYCKEEIVKKYGFHKVAEIVRGGKERYLSVYQGLLALQSSLREDTAKEHLVYIHDGARPCINHALIDQLYEDTIQYKASIAAVPVKDTIKIVNENGFVEETPKRSCLWQIQTPQVFLYSLIYRAYGQLLQSDCEGITDDAMVLEKTLGYKSHITLSSYENIKITTPEDMALAKLFSEKICSK